MLDNYIQRWTSMINESLDEGKESEVTLMMRDLFKLNSEVEVIEENGETYVCFDDSGYSSGSEARHEWEAVIEEVAVYAKKNNLDYDVSEDDHSIKVFSLDSVNEDDETTEKKDEENQELTLREFFEKAKNENAELKVTFIKVTNGDKRIATFSTTAGKGCYFDDQVKVSPKVLKKINKNHDRVFSQQAEYIGSLVTFPEKITDDSNITHPPKIFQAEDGTEWQWRRLYIQQIQKLEFNGSVVWENNGLFTFKLAGKDGELLTILSKEDYEKQQNLLSQYNASKVRDEATRKLQHKKIAEMAKDVTEEECSHNFGWANGWSDSDEEEKMRRAAIFEKHNQLCHQFPDKHEVCNKSSYHDSTHGYNHYQCKGCGFGYSVDSSD